MRSVIIDGPDSWSQTLVKEGIAERFIGLDFSDADTVFDRSLDAIKKAQSVRSPSYFALGDLGSALCCLHALLQIAAASNLLTTVICQIRFPSSMCQKARN